MDSPPPLVLCREEVDEQWISGVLKKKNNKNNEI
uniref:Uncharacterized protein n=1 Tax=Nelumbo nucifera TaxID=4432 RepID=A0A822XJ82_NELNU|nr:TPA_asm: hypothetical protein HUJ06_020509 [Nelumbo nucifera]